MNSKVLLTAFLIAVFVVGYYGSSAVAFAQYMGNVGGSGETGKFTLEEALELQRRRIESVQANPEAGSGTPVIDAAGVGGAAVITAAVLGGISGAFMIKSRSGKYAAYGRG
jgi:hypothetical protein